MEDSFNALKKFLAFLTIWMFSDIIERILNVFAAAA